MRSFYPHFWELMFGSSQCFVSAEMEYIFTQVGLVSVILINALTINMGVTVNH